MFEDAALRALILSFFAGMSTLLGALTIFFANKKSEKLVTVSLGFAGGVMLSVSFTDLLPNATQLLSEYYNEKLGIVLSVVFLLIGVLFAAMLDRFVPHEPEPDGDGKKHENLFRVKYRKDVDIMFEDAALRALILSFFAGMSTLLGALTIFFANKKSEKLVTVSLGFAGGVMLSVSFTDLLPNATQLLSEYYNEKLGIVLSVVFLLIGVLFAAMLDRFVPHEPEPDGDGKKHENLFRVGSVVFLLIGVLFAAMLDRFVPHEPEPDGDGKKHENLFRVGFVSTLAIGLHNFPEGIATFMAGYEDLTLGVSIALAITMHNIPEGISVAMPIYFATGSKLKAFKYTFLSGIAEPIGALLAFLVLKPFINSLTLGMIVLSVVFLLIRVLLAAMLDRFVPQEPEPDGDGQNHENLFRVGFVSTLAIGIHNIPEGIAMFMAGY